MIYAWKDAGRLRFKTDAQVAGEVCSRLEQEGRLTGKALVEVSRPTDAPLHDEFIWDDTIAAEKYRESQARDIISHISVVSESAKEPIRAFLNVSVGNPVFDSINVIVRNEDKYAALCKRALAELISFQKRYSMISKLDKLTSIIEELEKEWNESA